MSVEDDIYELSVDTTEKLVSAYRLQDSIEDITDFEGKQETDAAETAYECMGTVYQREFPDTADEAAYQAGKHHMDALFRQDIIENEDKTVEDALYDDRWEEVLSSLHSLCDCVGLEKEYGRDMTEFFRLHGQRRPGWEDRALAAQQTKVAHITGDPVWGDLLAPFFVKGVAYHDRHTDEAWEQAHELITQYYNNLFSLNDITGE